ncbi:MAG TPA: hypothetical protein IAB12_02315 [Candidatus Ornithospirochaeta avicola]|uniref:Outer membrane protein beta-barrel domain-containing protein n=1 Tax=Candidatus Ornithospirochaeta avicola TaxID=2840896 RepID=A0A9D1PS71_9SPIO|nr:hypothetical protein [Candidatus Ornithospirochaeta avicola]
MKKIALLLLALVLVFPVFAADNRVDFSMGYGGTFLYSTEVKSDPTEIQKLDFTFSGANYFLADGDMGIAYAVDLAMPTVLTIGNDNTNYIDAYKLAVDAAKLEGIKANLINFDLGLSVMFDYNLDITEELSMDFAAGLGYDWTTVGYKASAGGEKFKESINIHTISVDTQVAVNYAFAESFAVRGGLNVSMPFAAFMQTSSQEGSVSEKSELMNLKAIGFGISGFVGVSYLY